jgi:hypothetical protein
VVTAPGDIAAAQQAHLRMLDVAVTGLSQAGSACGPPRACPLIPAAADRQDQLSYIAVDALDESSVSAAFAAAPATPPVGGVVNLIGGYTPPQALSSLDIGMGSGSSPRSPKQEGIAHVQHGPEYPPFQRRHRGRLAQRAAPAGRWRPSSPDRALAGGNHEGAAG